MVFGHIILTHFCIQFLQNLLYSLQISFREDNYVDGGEDYMTFSGCSVNIGQAMNPKSGEFTVPEPGLYLFLVTCCTFDMKKCLLSIRKNGKDVANIFDQDGDTNKVSKQITTPPFGNLVRLKLSI